MANTTLKRISGSKYKYVGQYQQDGSSFWWAELPLVSKKKYNTEKEAAIAVDRYLIGKGREPLNILIRIIHSPKK